MKIEMPNEVRIVLDKLKENGYEGYLVGGCVRDSIMNRVPNDWDITTNAKPEQIMDVFENTIPTGLKYGTITVVIDDFNIEVTTYRTDGFYADGRHPDTINFANSLEEDLKRRDFTINAMAYNDEYGLIDLFDGKQDIKEGIIKFIGEPIDRIEEDSLRMLRAVRFCSQLNFRIDYIGFNAILENSWKLIRISKERVSGELNKILLSDRPSIGINCLDQTGLLHSISFELANCDIPQNNPYHVYGLLKHLMVTTDCIENKLHLRLSALLHDIGKPEVISTDENNIDHFYDHVKASESIARMLLTTLKYDNKTIDKVCKLILYHDRQIGNSELSIKRTLNLLDGDVALFKDLIELKIADSLAQNPLYTRERLNHANNILKTLENIIMEEQAFKVKHLKINGFDLIKIGFRGRQIGEILKVLLEQVMSGRLQNTNEQLAEYSKLIYNSNILGESLQNSIHKTFLSETKHLQCVHKEIND